MGHFIIVSRHLQVMFEFGHYSASTPCQHSLWNFEEENCVVVVDVGDGALSKTEAVVTS
jgi:hypothetical protein